MDSPGNVTLGTTSSKYRDILIQYDLDYDRRATIVRQREYYEGAAITPIPSLLQARVVQPQDLSKKVPRSRQFKPRNVAACFENPATASGASTRRVVVPYRPTDGDHKNLVVQILDAPGVVGGEYSGESLDRSTKPYFVQPDEQP